MSTPAKDTLLLVDGLSMAFRAFFALPVDNFATAEGTPTNAVYGFTAMLTTLIQDRNPSHVAVAFDLPGGTFRTERLPSYKGTRDATPPEFEPQVPLMREVLDALGVVAVDKARFEADDLLATYATLGKEAGMTVWVVSGDRDTIQLVNDDVTLLYPRKGVSDLVEFTPAAVEEKYGIPPHRYPDLAALVGESSDNLPGVPGVGPKTAAKWITTYGGLEGILAHSAEIPGKVGESLRDHLDTVKLNRELNHLLTDLEVPRPLADLEYKGGDSGAIHRICDALQFRGMRSRLLGLAARAGGTNDQASDVSAPDVPVSVSFDLDALLAIEGTVALEITSPDPWGVAISQGSQAWAFDMAQWDQEQEKKFDAWLSSAAVSVVAHGAKDVLHKLARRGLAWPRIAGDTQLAAYLVNPAQGKLELDDVSEREFGVRATSSTAGELDLGLGSAPLEDLAKRAVLIGRLDAAFNEHLAERGMTALYVDLEIPLTVVLANMEEWGVAVDSELLTELHTEALGRASVAAQQAYAALDGETVKLGSPQQLQTVLFDRLGMPKTKKIKTGYSTDAASLAELYEKKPHPFLEALLAHRDATKLSQMIQTLRDSVATDHRIHTTFSQVVASTGRLSSRDPNLQNIPIRTEEGHRIREAFVVGSGFETLLTADYSQIEMRIMAHLSGDPGLIEAFSQGEDLHRFVGSRVFGVPPEGVTSDMRSQVKAMSYGLVYGLSAFGLSRQLGLPVGEAQALMDDYFARFGGVRDYLADVVKQASKDGYTQTIFGRRRYLPDLTSTNRQRREIAERMALNAPIQGSAADIIKRAMLTVDSKLAAGGYASRQVLQVHDELVVEIAPGEAEAVKEIVIESMASAAELSVPLDVHLGSGTNWRSAGH